MINQGISLITLKCSVKTPHGTIRVSPKTVFPEVKSETHAHRFAFCSTVHKEFVPEGQTVNGTFYKGVMDWLLKQIAHVCLDSHVSKDCFLLHDNVPAHNLTLVCKFLVKKGVAVIYHSLYFREIVPTAFLFPKLKRHLHNLILAIKRATMRAFSRCYGKCGQRFRVLCT